MAKPTAFIDDVAVAARAAEVPNASFIQGMGLGGSNACGIGINMEGGAVVGTPEQFTLLDQHGNARTGQISQHIGGSGLGAGTSGTSPDATIRFGENNVLGHGGVAFEGNCALPTLAGGWVVGA